MNQSNALDQWLTDLHRQDWEDRSLQSRIDMLQGLEHVMAAEQGRPELRVVVMSPEEQEGSGSAGYFDGEKIVINGQFLTDHEPSKLGVDYFTVAGAVNTILHEGRHAWQRYIADHGAEGVDDAMRGMLLMNFRNYKAEGAECGAQVIELDARRYAREQYDGLLERMRTLGWEPDEVYFKQQMLDQMEEETWAESIKAELTEARLDDMDLKARLLMAFLFPKIDTQNLSLFDTARELLQGKLSVQEFIDGKPLAFTDAEKLRFSEKTDAFAELESAFWEALDGPLDSQKEAERPDDIKIRPIGKGVVF